MDQPVKSLEFERLPLMAVELRVHPNVPMFEMDLAFAAKLEAEMRGTGRDVQATNLREAPVDNMSLLVTRPSAVQQIVAADPGRALSVTIQDTMIKAVWLRNVGESFRPYPRFAALLAEFEWAAEVVGRLSGNRPGQSVVNMTYVNFVSAKAGSEEPAVLGVLSERFRQAIPPDASQVHELNVRWRQRGGLDRALFVGMAEAVLGAPAPQAVPGFMLRTITGMLADANNASQVLRRCHDDLQSFFVECTSAEARREWGQTDV